MAFFPINKSSRFGGELVTASKMLIHVVDSVSLQVARVTAMTDAQVTSEYGTTLTRTQLLTTLTDIQTRLNDPSITAITTQLG